jgi:hypothetical protein
MAPGEHYALNGASSTFEPTYDEQYLSKVDYDLVPNGLRDPKSFT